MSEPIDPVKQEGKQVTPLQMDHVLQIFKIILVDFFSFLIYSLHLHE